MPTIFGRSIGTPPSLSNRGVTVAQRPSSAPTNFTQPINQHISKGPIGGIIHPTHAVAPSPALVTTKSSGTGVAPTPNPIVNAVSNSVSFTDTVSGPSDKTYILQAAGDYVALTLGLTVTATGNTGSTDILNAINTIRVFSASGMPITLQPVTDVYALSQRFSFYGQKPATVLDTGATAVSGTYYLAGFALPASQGPYTIEIVVPAPSAFTSTTTALSVTYSLMFEVGTASHLLHYTSSALPIQPSADGEQDYGPIAAVQDIPLSELFLMGLNGPTDLAVAQISVGGSVVTQNTSGTQLAALTDAKLTAPIPASELMFCLPLNTGLTLGRSSSVLLTWGSSPATSGVRVGYAYFTPA